MSFCKGQMVLVPGAQNALYSSSTSFRHPKDIMKGTRNRSLLEIEVEDDDKGFVRSDLVLKADVLALLVSVSLLIP